MSKTSPLVSPPHFGPPSPDPNQPDFGPPKVKPTAAAPTFGPPQARGVLGTTAPAEALDPYAYVDDEKLAARIDNLEDILTPAMVAKKLMAPPASALRTAADLLSRGMFAAAGTTEEVMKGTPQNIPSRILKETLSGVAGIRGQKKDFMQVLAEGKVPEGARIPIPSGIADFFEISKEPFSVRDVAGLTLDLAADPLNFVGFGPTNVVRKLPVMQEGKYVGELTLSRKGIKELSNLAKQERPQAMRYAMRLAQGEKNALSERLPLKQAMAEARDIEVAADEVAYEAAASRIADKIAAGTKGLEDRGGFKVFGKTVLGTRPSSVTQLKEATSPGRDMMKTPRAVFNELDRAFNETDRFARSIPGYEEIKVKWRDYRHNHLVGPGGLKQTVHALTDNLDEASSTAIVRHVDNPAKYPLETVPEAWRHLVPKAKSLFTEWFEKEARRDLIPAESYRQNYIPHMWDNTPEQLAELSTHYTNRTGRSMGQFSLGPSKETRSFNTIDEAEEFAKALKAEGIINWDLKPVTDLKTLISRRGVSHINAMAADQFFTTIKARLGVSTGEMQHEILNQTFPEIYEAVHRMGQKEYNEVFKRIFGGELGTTRMEDVLRLYVKRGQPVPRKVMQSLTGEEKAAILTAHARDIGSLGEYNLFLKRYGKYLEDVTPQELANVKYALGILPYRLSKAWGYGGEPLLRRAGDRFEGWWLPRQIHRDLDGMEKHLVDTKDVATLLKGFDFIQDAFKLGNTVLFPAYHTRNAYSNVAANYVSIGLGALDPRKYVRAARVMLGHDGTLLTPLRRYTYDEVRKIAWEQGIFKDFAQQAELRSGSRSSIDNIPLLNIASKGGSGIENDSRLMLFMKHMEDGATPEQAAKMVKRFLFDYEAISPIERQVISRAVPFWIWRKKNLALTMQEMARNPGRYAAQAKLLYNPGESGPDPRSLPDYLRGSLKVKLAKGPNARFLTGIDLPVNSALETVFNESVEKTLATNASSIHPVLKSIMELSTGKELFSGRDLYEPVRLGGMGLAIKKMPKPVQEWLEFRETEDADGKPVYYASGVKTYILFRGWAQARMISTYDRVLKSDTNLKSALLDVLVGLRTKEIDTTEGQEKVIRARVQQLEKQLYQKGQMKKVELYQPAE